MLDSVLTITKGAAAWMIGAILVCLLADRAVAALTGMPATIFLFMALGVLFALTVTTTYTVGKWVWHRMFPTAG
jgi:hypothetical protein